ASSLWRLTGRRTLNPSALIISASAGRQTRWRECLPNSSLEASNDPYEAPISRILYAMLVPPNARRQAGTGADVVECARCYSQGPRHAIAIAAQPAQVQRGKTEFGWAGVGTN